MPVQRRYRYLALMNLLRWAASVPLRKQTCGTTVKQISINIIRLFAPEFNQSTKLAPHSRPSIWSRKQGRCFADRRAGLDARVVEPDRRQATKISCASKSARWTCNGATRS